MIKARIVILIAALWFTGLGRAQATEPACEFDTNSAAYTKFSFKNRLATGESEASGETAKSSAIKRMQNLAKSSDAGIGQYPCGGKPQIACIDARSFTLANGKLYRAQIGFVCPNDEGYAAESAQKYFDHQVSLTNKAISENSNLKQFVRNYIEKSISDPYRGNNFGYQSIKEQCGVDINPSDIDPKLWVIRQGDRRGRYHVRGLCPKSKPMIQRDPLPKPAKDSPDPRINWLGQKDFSNKSYAAAKVKVDANIAKRNLCRMRGGATDFEYSEKYTEQYWVTAKYRCQYD